MCAGDLLWWFARHLDITEVHLDSRCDHHVVTMSKWKLLAFFSIHFAMAATTLLLQASSSAVAALSAGGGKWRIDKKTNQTCSSTSKVSLRRISTLGQKQYSGGLRLKEFISHGEIWTLRISWLTLCFWSFRINLKERFIYHRFVMAIMVEVGK